MAEAHERISGRNPTEYPWGIYSADDMSIGGTAMFTWFKTPVELLAFVGEISLGFVETEAEADLRKQIGECRSRLGTLDKPNDQILLETNKILENEYTSIPWWGSFEELCVDQVLVQRGV